MMRVSEASRDIGYQSAKAVAQAKAAQQGFKTTSRYLISGEPCTHPGCAAHVTKPCEGCGRQGAL